MCKLPILNILIESCFVVGCVYLTFVKKLTVHSFLFEKLKCAEITFGHVISVKIMLRSIFSLIQNIIDSDREYSNKKSKTVIYLVSTPDNNINMDLEIDGQQRENMKSVKDDQMDSSGSKDSYKIATEQGDTLTCKHSPEGKIKPTTKYEDEKLIEEYKDAIEKYNERITFTNDEVVGKERKIEKVKSKAETLDELSVRDVWERIPPDQLKSYQKVTDRDQIEALMEQIHKMKLGMERLQEIAQQFNSSSQFKQDIEFLTKNVGAALEKSEEKYLEPKL